MRHQHQCMDTHYGCLVSVLIKHQPQRLHLYTKWPEITAVGNSSVIFHRLLFYFLKKNTKLGRSKSYLVYLLFWMRQEMREIRQNITIENNLCLFISTSYYVAYCSQCCCLNIQSGKEKKLHVKDIAVTYAITKIILRRLFIKTLCKIRFSTSSSELHQKNGYCFIKRHGTSQNKCTAAQLKKCKD